MTPKEPIPVSVLIPCFNNRATILGTLRSCAREGAAEIIVVDDGSSDGSAALVEGAFPEVRVFRTPNRGASHARNLAFAESTQPWIKFLDADDLLAPGSVERQWRLAESSGADAIYGCWREFEPGPDGEPVFGPLRDQRMAAPPEVDIFVGFWAPTAAYLWSREIVIKVGGMRESLPVIQDARFVLDAAMAGARFDFDPMEAAYYRKHLSGSLSTRSRARFVEDLVRNTAEIAALWAAKPDPHRDALFQVFSHTIPAALAVGPDLYQRAWALFQNTFPGQVPDRRPWFRCLARLAGYRNLRLALDAVRPVLHLARTRFTALRQPSTKLLTECRSDRP